jgi:hypothetical protein
VKYLVDANVLSEPTKPTPDPRVVAWFRAHEPEIAVVDPVGPAGRAFVQVHGHAQIVPDFGRHALRQADALFQRDAFDGDERDHVGGADARVGALVPGEIDQLDGFRHAAQGGVGHRGGWAYEGEDRAIVIGIRLAVQQDHLGDGEDRLNDGIHLGGIASFGKIGNTLHQLSWHEFIQ